MMEYAKDLRKQVLAAVSSVEIDQAEFTNKGNLTTAVLEQLFQPLIEITGEKRLTWGDYGLAPFFANVARGLTNAGLAPLGVTDAEESTQVLFQWPAFFELTEDERTNRTNRLNTQVDSGLLTHDRALREVCQMEGREDVETLAKELAPVAEAAHEGRLQKLGPQPEREPAFP
jgi:hypothetical protein